MPGLKQGDFYIGSMQLIDRKRPSLVIMRGNRYFVIGTFYNEACVKDFQNALKEMYWRGMKKDADEIKIC